MSEILLRVLLARRRELGVSLAHERFEHSRLHTHRELGLVARGIAVRGEPVGQLGELREQIIRSILGRRLEDGGKSARREGGA